MSSHGSKQDMKRKVIIDVPAMSLSNYIIFNYRRSIVIIKDSNGLWAMDYGLWEREKDRNG